MKIAPINASMKIDEDGDDDGSFAFATLGLVSGSPTLWHHAKADTLGLGASASVNAIPSAVGPSYTQATVANRGTYIQNGLNGKGIVRLDGVNDYYTSSFTARNFNSGMSFIMVAKVNYAASTGASHRWFSFSNATDNDYLAPIATRFMPHIRSSSTQFTGFWSEGGIQEGTSPGIVNGTWYVVGVRMASTAGFTPKWRRNASVSPGAYARSNAWINQNFSRMGIGWEIVASPLNFISMDWAETLIWESVLSDADWNTAFTQLGLKWGITV